MSRLLVEGTTVVITPDGPKGPRMRFKAGAVKAAQMTGAPLVALTGSARPRKRFGSWDRLCLPLPFARGIIHLDRKSVVSGKSVSVRVDLGGRRILTQKMTMILRILLITTITIASSK